MNLLIMDEVERVAQAFFILDRIPFGSCILREDLVVVFWNSRLEEWTKIPRHTILGRSIVDFFPHLEKPKYKTRLKPIFQGGPPTIFSSQLHKHIIPAKLPNGDLRIQHTTVTSIPRFEGDSYYAILAIQDVTDLTERIQDYRQMRDRALEEIKERQQAQEALYQKTAEFEAIFKSIPDAVVFANLSGEMILLNPAFSKLFGYSSEEMLGQPISVLQADYSNSEQNCYGKGKYSQARDGAIASDLVQPYEVEYQRKNRDIFVGETIDSVVKDGEGKTLGLLRIVRDITERKQAAGALESANQKLKDWVTELENRHRETLILREMSDLLQACLTVEEAYAVIARSVQLLFPNLSGALFILDDSKKLVEAVAQWGDVETTETVFLPQECWALRRGREHFVCDNRGGLPCKHVLNDGLEYSCTPLMAQGKGLGTLYLCSEKSGEFTASKQLLTLTVTEQISLSLANLTLRETLKQQSIRDPLTGLYNRRYLQECLGREIHRARNQNVGVGVIMLDVDRFKQFNDSFGHEAGDEILKKLASFLQENNSEADIACRYGGEEFTVILPQSSLEQTQEKAHLLREGVRLVQVRYQQQLLGPLTISVGVANFPEHGQSGDALLRAADTALYRAKREGRDRTVVAE
ncbi:sensor domain-containing diguanylate cyclase [Oxynema aestuarii]|uniref:Diguanylate cyclase n=1 Tax=Oxynema aestuarii AP17 TaxID=2064643 RepID=A0A6H1TVK0_9CYAN|nr:diguanylate cyclase [Oxynema aestuarii]QIZ70638.1 diguanylate cyclase [Oxynema aestuarii AP17]RMH76242.1 MAG: diguanylate cyclase [Cyanobacteria bacterium J007]